MHTDVHVVCAWCAWLGEELALREGGTDACQNRME
jgi:hypothetical protein